MRSIIKSIILCCLGGVSANGQVLPANQAISWGTGAGTAGSFVHSSGNYTVTARGTAAPRSPVIAGNKETYYYVYKQTANDWTLTATLSSLTGGNTAKEAGLVVRTTNTAVSTSALAGVALTVRQNKVIFSRRSANGLAVKSSAKLPVALPVRLCLQRCGSSYFASYWPNDATDWIPMVIEGSFGGDGTETLPSIDGSLMPASGQVGLAVGSGNPTDAVASFTQVDLVEGAANGTGSGLSVKMFNNTDFTSPASTGQTTRYLDLKSHLKKLGPPTGVTPTTFSSRWEGRLTAKYSELHDFVLRSRDGVRLWINGDVVIDDWIERPVTESRGSYPLIAGQQYNLVVESFVGKNPECLLMWESPSQQRLHTVPVYQLQPPAQFVTGLQTPDSLAVPTTTPNGIALKWDPSLGATGPVEYLLESGQTTLLSTSGTSATIGGFLPGSSMEFRVRAKDNTSNVASGDLAGQSTAVEQRAISWLGRDLGATSLVGSEAFQNGRVIVSGGGSGISAKKTGNAHSDECRFLYQIVNRYDASFSFVARLNQCSHPNSEAVAGIMIRDGLGPTARFALMGVSQRDGAVFAVRTTNGSNASVRSMPLDNSKDVWIRLTISANGRSFDGEISSDGVTWDLLRNARGTPISSATVRRTFGDEVQQGLIVTSGDNDVLTTAIFDNVSGDRVQRALPKLTLTPANGSRFDLGAGALQVPLSVSVVGADSEVRRIRFSVDDVQLSEDIETPFTAVWQPATVGRKKVKAEAFYETSGSDPAVASITNTIDIFSNDADLDGLPDQWERDHFGGTTLGQLSDLDGDGWSALEEYQRGTSPTVFDLGDIDKDGISDAWEAAFFGSTSKVSGAVSLPGLISWWRFNGNLADSGAGTQNATTSGSPTPSYVNPGIASQAITFAGGNSVDLPSPARFSGKAFSLNTWVKPNTGSGSSARDFFHWRDTLNAGWRLGRDINGRLAFAYFKPSVADRWIRSAKSFPENAWSMLTVTCDAQGLVRLYINGEQTAYGPVDLAFGTANLAKVGMASWQGAIDELKYFNRPLDPTEILSLYQDPAEDFDGDTVSNGSEFNRGSNPLNIDTDVDTFADNLDSDPIVPALSKEIVWIDDALPQGAVAEENAFAWIGRLPFPVSGRNAARTLRKPGLHGYAFSTASQPLTLAAGEKLVAYVYLEPGVPQSVPRELMLEWWKGSAASPDKAHRAFWGDDLIILGTINTASRRRIADLPTVGVWQRLVIDPSQIGLVAGDSLCGLAVRLYDGAVRLDRIAKDIPPTVALPTIYPPTGTYLRSFKALVQCATSGVELRYTTNGSTPTTSSTLVPSSGLVDLPAISTSGNTTLKVIAFKTGWTASAVAQADYLRKPDSDGDGMSDEYEIAMGLNPNLADANGNLDGDGALNYQDVRPGDPTKSVLTIQIDAPQNNAVLK